MSGKKTVETRGYSIPKKYLGVELALIETPGLRSGPMGRRPRARVIGKIVFERCFQYRDKLHWLEDHFRHLVSPEDRQFAYKPGQSKWGWEISSISPLELELPLGLRKGIIYTTAVPVSSDQI